MVKVPYMKKLEIIREVMENMLMQHTSSPFPYNHCYYATRVLNKILGLVKIGGFHEDGGFVDHHAWNFDPERMVHVDLTLDQFSSKYPKIAILPLETDVLVPEYGATLIYRSYGDGSYYNLEEVVGAIRDRLADGGRYDE